ncbi:hypothetical protein K9M79_03015 [Candidatus Woesearchaeota archaeon]|nr:hypothetical protein [Candidatus Woesearchaeota archaeon]
MEQKIEKSIEYDAENKEFVVNVQSSDEKSGIISNHTTQRLTIDGVKKMLKDLEAGEKKILDGLEATKNKLKEMPKFTDRKLQNLKKFRDNFENIQKLQEIEKLDKMIKQQEDYLKEQTNDTNSVREAVKKAGLEAEDESSD